MSRMQDSEEELIKMSRKNENLEKINKELTDYVTILKKNVDENKKKVVPLQEENSTLTKTIIEKNDKIQLLESQITSLLKEDKTKDNIVQELSDKLNKYKEIFQFVTMKTKTPNKKVQNESLTYSIPYDFPMKKHVTESPSLTDLDHGSPPGMARAYSSIISKNCETKPDFRRKITVKKATNDDFIRGNNKNQEFQKEVEQFYSFDKKKSGFYLKNFPNRFKKFFLEKRIFEDFDSVSLFLFEYFIYYGNLEKIFKLQIFC